MTQFDQSKRFVLLSSQRSGSTWLISILNQLEDAAAFGELFLYRQRTAEQIEVRFDFDYPRYLETPPSGLSLRPFSVFAYLDQFYDQPGTVGFKLMYSQWRKYPELLLYFRRRQVRIIHLVRRNHLNVILSRHVKAMTQQAHLVTDEKQAPFTPVELDSATLLRRLRAQQRMVSTTRQLLRLSGLPFLEVAYEDLVQDPIHFDSLWNFLGINPQGQLPQSQLKKIGTRHHRDVIGNYHQVRTTLLGTPFAHLLE